MQRRDSIAEQTMNLVEMQIVFILLRPIVIPGVFILAWLTGCITLLCTLKIFLISFLTIFVFIPIVFKYSLRLQRFMLFLNFVDYPRGIDYTKPSAVGLYATRNFYVDVNEKPNGNNKVKIGVWHILPMCIAKKFSAELNINEEIFEDISSISDGNDSDTETIERSLKSEFRTVDDSNEQEFYERALSLAMGTILYLHGNTASRGSRPRIELYSMLRKLGYHVLTIDYRGYGDSDRVQPTEEGLVQDALGVYNYIQSTTANPVYIWGHSLGTGVTTHLLSILTKENIPGPQGVVLESPFTNMQDEIRKHEFAKPFVHLPWFDYMVPNSMYQNSLRFESDKHISEFPQPILILHAEDDLVVPFNLGYSLYKTGVDTRNSSWGPIEFHSFSGSYGYGHKFLCRSPDLPEIVKTFFDTYRNEVFSIEASKRKKMAS